MSQAIQIPVTQVGLEQSIAAAMRRAGNSSQINLGTNSRQINALSQPLGRITGQADEFSKSMEAANARVLAFGASAGIIAGVSSAMAGLVRSTIEVEKRLVEVNAVLGTSSAELDKFGQDIFNVAKNTGKSFAEVSTAALELARQGLSAEDTLTRLNDAMILSRLSGLDATKSVEGLTAAFNSFKSSGISTAEILDNIVAAAQKFAVSEKDIIEALGRSASVADLAGVSFNELAAIVTAVQEKTARGGAVIGNSLKTIFARIQDKAVLSDLQEMGIAVTGLQGEVLPALKILENLAAQMGSFSQIEQADIAKKLGGVYQLDKLLAALKDLSSESSVYRETLKEIETAAGSAYKKNAVLNETLAALINKVAISAEQLGAKLGEIGVTDNLKNILGFFNNLLEGIQKVLGEESGLGTLVRGLVKGLGNFLSGPGLALFGAIILKLSKDLVQFGFASLKAFFGIGKAAKDVQNVESAISQILSKNVNLQQQLFALEGNRAAQLRVITTALVEQEALLRRSAAISSGLAGPLSRVGVRATDSGLRINNKAGGYMPAVAKESQAINSGVGGARRGDKPVVMPNFNFGGGKKGTIVAHTGEYVVPNFGGGKGSAIFNRDMVQKMGLPSGAKKITASGGLIPNFKDVEITKKVSEFSSLGRLVTAKKVDSIDSFTSSISPIEQALTSSEYTKKAQNQLKEIVPKFGRNNLQINKAKLDKTLEFFKKAGVDNTSIQTFNSAVQNLDPKRPTSGQFLNIENRMKGILGEIDASEMSGQKLNQGNSFLDLSDGSEVKTVKSQKASEILKKGINQYLLSSNIYDGEDNETQLGKIPVYLPKGTPLLNSASGFIPNFAPKFNAETVRQYANDIEKYKSPTKDFYEFPDGTGGYGANVRLVLSRSQSKAVTNKQEKEKKISDKGFYNLSADALGGILLVSPRFGKARGSLDTSMPIGKIPFFNQANSPSIDKNKYIKLGGIKTANTPSGRDLQGLQGDISQLFADGIVNLAYKLYGSTFDPASGGEFTSKLKSLDPSKKQQLLPAAAQGDLFEAAGKVALNSFANLESLFGSAEQSRPFDFQNASALQKMFGVNAKRGEAKRGGEKNFSSSDQVSGIVKKVFNDPEYSLTALESLRGQGAFNFSKAQKAATVANAFDGFIPNFAKYIYDSDRLNPDKGATLAAVLASKVKKNLIIGPAGSGKSTFAGKMGQFLSGIDDVSKASEIDILSGAGRAKGGISKNLESIIAAVNSSGGKVSYLYAKNLEILSRRIGRTSPSEGDLRSVKQLKGTKYAPLNQFDFLSAVKSKARNFNLINGADGFIPNFVRKSREIGSGAFGTFFRLGKNKEGSDVGVKKFKSYIPSRSIEAEWLTSEFVNKYANIPSVFGPANLSTFEDSKRKRAIRKAVVSDPLARTAIGSEKASSFGQKVLFAAFKARGLEIGDFHGSNYTLNKSAQDAISGMQSFPSDPVGAFSVLRQIAATGGRIGAIDVGAAHVTDPARGVIGQIMARQAAKTTAAGGFVPNFALSPKYITETLARIKAGTSGFSKQEQETFLRKFGARSTGGKLSIRDVYNKLDGEMGVSQLIDKAYAQAGAAASSEDVYRVFENQTKANPYQLRSAVSKLGFVPNFAVDLTRSPEQIENKRIKNAKKQNWKTAQGAVGKIFGAIDKAGPTVLVDGIISGAEIHGLDLDYIKTLIENNGAIAQMFLGDKGSNFVIQAKKYGITVQQSAMKKLTSFAAKSLNKVQGLAGGFLPNFASPLQDAVGREMAAGVPASQIYIDKSPSLKNAANPMGLMVANRRDEPAGGFQGINRARKEGANPMMYGAAGGFVPNYAAGATGPDLSPYAGKSVADATAQIQQELTDSLKKIDDEYDNQQKSLKKTSENLIKRGKIEADILIAEKNLLKQIQDNLTAAQKAGGKSPAARAAITNMQIQEAQQQKAVAAARQPLRQTLDERRQIAAQSQTLTTDRVNRIAERNQNATNLQTAVSQNARRSVSNPLGRVRDPNPAAGGNRDMLGTIFAVQGALSALTGATEGATGAFTSAVNGIASSAGTATTALFSIQGLSEAFGGAEKGFGKFLGKLGPYAAAAGFLYTGYQELTKHLDKTNPNIQKAGEAMSRVAEAASKAAVNLNNLNPAAQERARGEAKEIISYARGYSQTKFEGYGSAAEEQLENIVSQARGAGIDQATLDDLIRPRFKSGNIMTGLEIEEIASQVNNKISDIAREGSPESIIRGLTKEQKKDLAAMTPKDMERYIAQRNSRRSILQGLTKEERESFYQMAPEEQAKNIAERKKAVANPLDVLQNAFFNAGIEGDIARQESIRKTFALIKDQAKAEEEAREEAVANAPIALRQTIKAIQREKIERESIRKIDQQIAKDRYDSSLLVAGIETDLNLSASERAIKNIEAQAALEKQTAELEAQKTIQADINELVGKFADNVAFKTVEGGESAARAALSELSKDSEAQKLLNIDTSTQEGRNTQGASALEMAEAQLKRTALADVEGAAQALADALLLSLNLTQKTNQAVRDGNIEKEKSEKLEIAKNKIQEQNNRASEKYARRMSEIANDISNESARVGFASQIQNAKVDVRLAQLSKTTGISPFARQDEERRLENLKFQNELKSEREKNILDAKAEFIRNSKLEDNISALNTSNELTKENTDALIKLTEAIVPKRADYKDEPMISPNEMDKFIEELLVDAYRTLSTFKPEKPLETENVPTTNVSLEDQFAKAGQLAELTTAEDRLVEAQRYATEELKLQDQAAKSLVEKLMQAANLLRSGAEASKVKEILQESAQAAKAIAEAIQSIGKTEKGQLENQLKALQDSPSTFAEGMENAFLQMQINNKQFAYLLGQDIPKMFSDGISSAINSAIEGTVSLKDGLRSAAYEFVKTINQRMMSNLVDKIVGGSVQSGGGGGGGGLIQGIASMFGMASGGMINGGSGMKDDVPAMLMGGEYVVNKKAVSKYGAQFLESINNGSLTGYAQGGAVQRGPQGNFYTPGTFGQGAISGKRN